MRAHAFDNVQVTYHRNGVSGVGFHLVTFDHDTSKMMAVVFDADQPGRECYTAVLNVRNLYADPSPLAMFDPNTMQKYRGDHFDAALLDEIRKATEAYDRAYDASLREPDGYRMGDGGTILPTSR